MVRDGLLSMLSVRDLCPVEASLEIRDEILLAP
jgi:hypothetical protein